jgi:hypothetical protein
MSLKDKKVPKAKAFIEEWFFKKGNTTGDAHTEIIKNNIDVKL